MSPQPGIAGRLPRALLIASPAYALALLGFAHPLFLTPQTADRWRAVHVLFLPLFPLLAIAVCALLRRCTGAVAWVARLAAFGYAVLYGALDAIAGIGAPATVQRRGRAAPIGDLFDAGDQLGHLGVLGLALALALTAGLLWWRTRSPWALGGGLVALAGCPWFYLHHVFAPRGVLALVAIGTGLALMALAERTGVAGPPAPSRAEAAALA